VVQTRKTGRSPFGTYSTHLSHKHTNTHGRKDLPHNSCDDIAGIVHSVGKNVFEFAPGDRVAALHIYGAENGGFAEYSVAPDHTTIRLPHNVSFEEAATLPTAALTASIALYADMKLPAPWVPKAEGVKTPILIYGVTSAVGAFAAKYARLSGLGPIIGVAGRNRELAETLADYVIDYRKGEDALVAAVEEVLAKEELGSKVSYVFDAISEDGSLEATLKFIDLNSGTVGLVLPPALFAKDGENFKYPPGVRAVNTALPMIHSVHKDFGTIWSRYMGRILADGKLKAHPYEVIPGGLGGVLTGLQKLKDGEASGVKYVFRVEETKDGETLISAKPSVVQSRKNTHPLRNFPFPAED
jgi:NADPH2:quinone reductase